MTTIIAAVGVVLVAAIAAGAWWFNLLGLAEAVCTETPATAELMQPGPLGEPPAQLRQRDELQRHLDSRPGSESLLAERAGRESRANSGNSASWRQSVSTNADGFRCGARVERTSCGNTNSARGRNLDSTTAYDRGVDGARFT